MQLKKSKAFMSYNSNISVVFKKKWNSVVESGL